MGRVAPPIVTSVGQDAINRPADVFVVQSLLNERLPKPHVPIDVTGTIDPGTILAIEAYQAVMMGMNPPTGRVDPGSATYYSLAARPLVNQVPPVVHFGHVGIVPSEVAAAAVASETRWRVPASVSLAQWAVESAWGAAMPPDSNNPFGIKATAGAPAVSAGTTEFVDGAPIVITARFRRFDNLDDAFEFHGQLLATGQPYRVAMQLVADPERFADALTGVYATDPHYGTTLTWVMDKYGFKRFDH
jgi:hypothetical protein